jgi:hypothetical protein
MDTDKMFLCVRARDPRVNARSELPRRSTLQISRKLLAKVFVEFGAVSQKRTP